MKFQDIIYRIKRRLFGLPPHVSAFGFDLYQNVHDIIDYSMFKNRDSGTYLGVRNSSTLKSKDEWSFAIIANHCSSGDAVIDIGANIGMMSLLMSRYVGSTGSVYSFEPGPVSYALLSRNAYVNAGPYLAPIVTEKCAVSDHTGNSNLFIKTWCY